MVIGVADTEVQMIGANPDAVRMQRVVSFYEKLPRGAAPEVKPQGFWGKYQAKHFGKNPTVKRMCPWVVIRLALESLRAEGKLGVEWSFEC